VNEAKGFFMSLAQEVVADGLLNGIFDSTATFRRKRKINAPFGITVPIPF